MKKLLSVLLVAAATTLTLSCKTTKACVSASAKSETVATSADRLCSSLMTDTTNQWFTLSVDSLVLILAERGITMFPRHEVPASLAAESTPPRDEAGASVSDDLYFLSDRSNSVRLLPEGRKKPPATNGRYSVGDKLPTEQSAKLHVYGLHIDVGGNKKSGVQSLVEESTDESVHSSDTKASDVRKSAPSQTPKYIFYILIIALAIFLYIKLRYRH